MNAKTKEQTLRGAPLAEFLSTLDAKAGSGNDDAWQVTVPGFELPMSLKFIARPEGGGVGKPVVFCFHGAVDREKRKVPVFEGAFLNAVRPRNAWVIALADPLLERHGHLRTTWYAGSETCDVPAMLKLLIVAILERLQASRAVFAATSTGGHAALVQSWHVPGSVAVVSNPITTISNYYKRHVTDFRQACWPSLAESTPWPEYFTDAVAKLYQQRLDHDVIYLNNAQDHHFWLQAVLFLHAVRRGDARTRLMLLSDFYADYTGHATPPAVLARWVTAACEAPGPTVLEVAQQAAGMPPAALAAKAPTAAAAPTEKQPAPRASSDRAPSDADLAIARRLLDALN